MNFDLNINVQIGITPQLATFLTALLQRPDTPAPLSAIEAPTPEVPAESDKPRRTRRTKADAPETVENPEAEAPAPAAPVEEAPAAPKPFAEAPVQQPDKPLTEEDIRACMHRTRQRFEGEDYKENTTGEGYKKYHKQLTSQFKQIAVILGADKPSALPVEQRAAFIAECDALIIGEDGNITPPPAPY